MGALATKLRAVRQRTRRILRRSRTLRIALMVLGALIVIGVYLDRGLDRPLREAVERRINASLVGYTAKVGRLDFHLMGLSMDLERVVVTQDAHPDPPVIRLPRLRMSVHWTDLLVLHLVADARFEHPTVYADLVQLREESQDPVPLSQRGWQQALESIYPLKINELRVVNGTLVYQDDSGFKPLYLSEVQLLAENIRNIRSRERHYPSTLHAEGWVFDVGRAVIDGHADFLAEPTPGVQGRLDLQLVELSYFEPIARRFGLTVRQGFVSGGGTVEVAPGIRSVDVESVVITAAAVDYDRGGAATPQARAAGQRISEAAKTALNNPEVLYRVRRLTMENGTLGVVNRVQDPPYRLFFSNADFELTNLSSRAEDGPALATLEGAFMGSGKSKANATFFPEGKHANFEGKIAIENTQLKSLNDLLEARGKFDVASGTFSLYSEVRVRDGYVKGYVKPLFRDVDVYETEQDKNKSVLKKMYEGIVGGVAKLLENKRGEIVTVTSLEGPIEDPKANTMQVIGGLLKNAFVKSILPGFQHEIARLEPFKYRAAKKKERKEEKRREQERKDERASLRR